MIKIYSFLGLQDISRINGVHPNCKIVRKWGKSYSNCEGIDITREYSIPPLRGMGESTSILIELLQHIKRKRYDKKRDREHGEEVTLQINPNN